MFKIPNWHLERQPRFKIKYLPFVYTKQGVAMLTSALHTDRASTIKIALTFKGGMTKNVTIRVKKNK